MGTYCRQQILSALATGAAIVFGGSGNVTFAQARPDAGIIQQELERGRPPGLVPPPRAAPLVDEPTRPALRAPAERTFLVKRFRITRNSAIPEAELLPLLQSYVGREVSLGDLERAAELISRYYRERGYFVARAYVPAQDIVDGVVEITVLEGRLDGVQLKLSTETRLRSGMVEQMVRSALGADGLMRLDELERGLLLLNDLPGVESRAVLLPGTALGTSVVAVEVREGPLVSGNLDIDTFGSKFSGPIRLGASLNLNNPSGYADQLSLRVTGSEGTHYGRIAYQLPVGASGLKLGGSYAETRYELCCEFAPLNANGDAQTGSLNASYPFIRGRNASLYGTAALDAKRFFNSTVAGTTSDKSARAVVLGVNGSSSDVLGSGGLNSYGFSLSSGRLDLDGWTPDRVADAASARTHGSYQKIAYAMARLQRLGARTSLYTGLSGQFASKNLDSSEKFILGGPLGVRAYPTGEAAGDEAMLLNIELRYDIRSALQVAAFLDHGEVRLHRNEWTGWQGANAGISNRYGLSGLGAALNWNQPGNFLVRFSIAHPIGDNPGRDVNGNDADNTRNRTRLWLQAVKFM